MTSTTAPVADFGKSPRICQTRLSNLKSRWKQRNGSHF